MIPFDMRALRSMYHDCPASDAALGRHCLTPQAVEPFTAPIRWTEAHYGSIPRAFIGCAQDRIYGLDEQRARVEALRNTEFVSLDSGHSPFFSMPEILADTLERLST